VQQFNDPLRMPDSGESHHERLARAAPLAGTPGQAYVERRRVPLEVAEAAGVRFDADFAGRPAVLTALLDQTDRPVSVHGRYLHNLRKQSKMLTVGPGGGVVGVCGGWRAEPLIVVEGLFDALSLAACGWACVATVGRWAAWLPDVIADRAVWLAFDATRPGEADVARYAERLPSAQLYRLPPPPRCKDWNTALVKHGRGTLARWVLDRLATGGRYRAPARSPARKHAHRGPPIELL